MIKKRNKVSSAGSCTTGSVDFNIDEGGIGENHNLGGSLARRGTGKVHISGVGKNSLKSSQSKESQRKFEWLTIRIPRKSRLTKYTSSMGKRSVIKDLSCRQKGSFRVKQVQRYNRQLKIQSNDGI